jgi:OOP family OmpA-OmpF porin
VIDELRFAAGAPAGFVDVAVAAVRAVNRLAGGSVEIADGRVAIHGVAYNDAAAQDAYDTIAAAMPDVSLIARHEVMTSQPGQPVSPDLCREMLQAALQTGRIEFDGDQEVIAPHSRGVLDRVSSAVGRCPGAAIEVAAHTDSSGSATANRTRTQARAEAIVDFMVGAGVKRERLTPVGYGESRPAADNGTEAGRAANRRIEFALTLPNGG